MEGSKKARKRAQDQARAAEMKRLGIERTTGRCPVCYALVNADFLMSGMATHRCGNDEKSRRR